MPWQGEFESGTLTENVWQTWRLWNEIRTCIRTSLERHGRVICGRLLPVHPIPHILFHKLDQPAVATLRRAAFTRKRRRSHPLRCVAEAPFVLFNGDLKQITDSAVDLASNEVERSGAVQHHGGCNTNVRQKSNVKRLPTLAFMEDVPACRIHRFVFTRMQIEQSSSLCNHRTIENSLK